MNRQFLSIATLTTTHLKQVTDKLATIKEDDLLKLDQAVTSYLFKRRQSKQCHQEESLEAKIRSELINLQEKNEFLMKEVDIMTRNYLQEKEDIRKNNQAWNYQHQEFSLGNLYQNFIKELIDELAPFKKITEYMQRLEALRKQSMEKEIIACNAQQFFQKIDEIMGNEDQEQNQSNDLQTCYF